MNRSALAVTVLPVIGIAAIVAEHAEPPWSVARIAGLVLALGGLSLVTVARLQLGNAFSVVPQARTLVTRGLYRRLRHPIYVFASITFVGVVLFLQMDLALLLVAAVVPVQVWRARAENRVLEQQFGDAYRAYASRTWF